MPGSKNAIDDYRMSYWNQHRPHDTTRHDLNGGIAFTVTEENVNSGPELVDHYMLGLLPMRIFSRVFEVWENRDDEPQNGE